MAMNFGSLGKGAARANPGSISGKSPEELKQEQEKRAERIQKGIEDANRGPVAPEKLAITNDFTPITPDPQYILQVNAL